MRLVSHPVLCNYYVTYRCNAKCHFCDIWEKPSPYATLENVSNNLLELKKLKVKVIDFTGGEPLLHRQIDEFLEKAKHLKFITTVTTNCLLYPKYAAKLKGKVDMLHFSLDYYDSEKHNRARGVDCYNHVIESIAIAKRIGEKPDILLTVFEDNIEDIGLIYKNICVPNNLVLILNPSFSYNDIKTKSLNDNSLKQLLKWGKEKKIYLNKAFIQLRQDGGNHIDNPICKAGSSTLVISPDNELVVPCYHLGTKKFRIDNNLSDIFLSPEVRKLIALEGRLPACEGCTVNCYMQPSFAVNVNKYWFQALESNIKYNLLKGTWKKLLT